MTTEGPSAWRGIIDAYRRPSTARALWQLANTVIPYLLLWALVRPAASISLWLVVPLAVLAGALLVRIFIVFHDCAHGSFFESSRANRAVGFVAGVMTFTPFDHWRWEHGIHHQGAADLDKRGTGDVWTLTVQEYLEASRCHEAHPMFERVRPLTLTDSFRTAALRLWDEETGTLVAFSHLRKREGTGCKADRCG